MSGDQEHETDREQYESCSQDQVEMQSPDTSDMAMLVTTML